MPKTNNFSWFEKLPKVELHVHLEGAIPLPALWELVKKYGGESSVPDLQALENKFQFRDFPHFIETWIWKNQFLREYADFTLIAEAVARDLNSQNIRYAETFFTPSDFFRFGLKTQMITEAIRTGLASVPGVKISLIADFCRNNGIQNAAKVIEEINEVKDLGVIGVTIGGSEQDFPPEPFAEVYERARHLGFHTSAHAGEAAGPQSIWGAINHLRVERIGHGTRACEDPSLMKYLVDYQIPLEVCPISNVKTRVVDSLKTHPVREYFEKGMLISINTDDPKMFGNSLAGEYAALEIELGFSRTEIKELILAAVRSAWLPDDAKLRYAQEFKNCPEWKG
jgi:adenosine deaminase